MKYYVNPLEEVTITPQSKGIRYNNYLNVRYSDDNDWVGEVGYNPDKEYEQFESPEYGVRAATKLIKTHYNRVNNTLTKLINVWAPPNENHTNNYIKYLSKKLNIDPNTQLNIDNNSLVNLINEMTYFENGQYGDVNAIRKGVNLK